MAAGDAAASAYLHPLADAAQVKHILRSSAHAIRALELRADEPVGPLAHDRLVEQCAARATPTVVEVLNRYPRPTAHGNLLAVTMSELDAHLRSTTDCAPSSTTEHRQ